MANRISTRQTGLLYNTDHIALNKIYDNLNGGTVPGFGILHGCELSIQGTGNTLRVNKGRVLLSGVVVEIEETNLFLGSSTNIVNYQVMLTINLLTNTAVITTPLATVNASMIDLIAFPDTDCQIQLGRYTFNNGLITNLVQGNKFPDLPMITQYYQLNARFSSGSYNSTTRIATWTVDKDLRSNIFPGTKLKFQSNLGTTYAIVHAITSTTITLFHQTGTASLATPSSTLINVGIGRPADFPEDDDNNWTVFVNSNTQKTTTAPTTGTWYNSKTLTVGVGKWKISARDEIVSTKAAGQLDCTTEFTIADSATTSGTYQGVSLIDSQGFSLLTGTVSGGRWVQQIELVETITTQKIKYSNVRVQSASAQILILNQAGFNYLKATSIYA